MLKESLPKPQKDLPVPEKEITAKSTPDLALQVFDPEAQTRRGPTLQTQNDNQTSLDDDGGNKRRGIPFLRSFLFGFIFVVLVVVIGGGAFFLGRSSVFKELNPGPPTIPPPDEPHFVSPTPEPKVVKLNYAITKLSSGNLFTENSYGFSFEYSNLKECCGISGPSSNLGNSVTFATTQTEEIGSDTPFDGFSVYVVPNTNNLPLDRFVDDEIVAFSKLYGDKEQQKKTVEAGILKGYFIENNGFGIDVYYFSFPDNKNFLVLGQLDKNSGSFENQFKQILSTFKFTDSISQSNQSNTSDWKTFNSSFGYSIKYPKDSEFINCEGKCNYGSQIKNKDATITFSSNGVGKEKSIVDFVKNSLCDPIGDNKVIEKEINGIKFYQVQKIIDIKNICLVAATEQIGYKTDDESYWLINAQVRANNQNGVDLFNQILSTFKFN